MPNGTATRKTRAGNIWYYLQTATDVIPLMSALLSVGFHTTLRAFLNNGVQTWELSIEDRRNGAENLPPQLRNRTMRLGDVAVYDPTTLVLSTMPKTDYDTNYTTNTTNP